MEVYRTKVYLKIIILVYCYKNKYLIKFIQQKTKTVYINALGIGGRLWKRFGVRP